jgi:hypothetical protein
LNPPTDLSRKQTGPGINLDRMFFPTITRLVPWGRGQIWSSKRWFFHRSTIWSGWWPEKTSSYSVAGKATNLISHFQTQTMCFALRAFPRAQAEAVEVLARN